MHPFLAMSCRVMCLVLCVPSGVRAVQTSTFAGLEQILPWLFYHKVVGVAHFLLFVEGRAAKPHITGVLESIPVCDLR